jgi:hypothetical protein
MSKFIQTVVMIAFVCCTQEDEMPHSSKTYVNETHQQM